MGGKKEGNCMTDSPYQHPILMGVSYIPQSSFTGTKSSPFPAPWPTGISRLQRKREKEEKRRQDHEEQSLVPVPTLQTSAPAASSFRIVAPRASFPTHDILAKR